MQVVDVMIVMYLRPCRVSGLLLPCCNIGQRDPASAPHFRLPYSSSRAMPAEDVIKAFKKFDKDGNGVISRSELSDASWWRVSEPMTEDPISHLAASQA